MYFPFKPQQMENIYVFAQQTLLLIIQTPNQSINHKFQISKNPLMQFFCVKLCTAETHTTFIL